jgi:hypothetical protein
LEKQMNCLSLAGSQVIANSIRSTERTTDTVMPLMVEVGTGSQKRTMQLDLGLKEQARAAALNSARIAKEFCSMRYWQSGRFSHQTCLDAASQLPGKPKPKSTA